MNKPALKRFATESRRELLARVELQARKIGITSEGIQKATIESSDAIFVNGRQLKEKEKAQRNKLISRIREIGFDRVMEEVAYTWFNRFTALRFMEVNDYLPTKVRVLSSTKLGSTEPDMMNEALSLDLDLDKEYVYELKLNNNDEELFKYLVIKHCNDLNRYMPFMFETIDHFTEILFPEGLLAAESFVSKMTDIKLIPESNWEKIEVIGWLYQYYIAEEKDRVFKAKKKYKAEEIPFATQLFTPDWIVRYMVQNSLGRYWVEANPEHQDLIGNWEFYLQRDEEGFEEKIAPYINKELKVEEIKCFDPAMGSGHILVYMFDVLYEIYSKSGYMEREIPRLIIENNLYGLDVDDRAYQLASFSVVMKAMEYNKRFLRSIEREGLTLNLASIQETNTLTKEDIEFLSDGSSTNLEKTQLFIQQFRDAKTIGSLIKIVEGETSHLQKRLEFIQTTPVTNLFEIEQREKVLSLLPKLIKQAKIMSLEFDILVTNPPYMGSGSMNKELGDYLKKNYPDSKSDLFAAFMEVDHYLKPNGFYGSINQHSWMFLSSFEKLRKKIIDTKFIDSLLHLGPKAFEEIGGEVVQTTAFILRNTSIDVLNGAFIRLVNDRSASEKRSKLYNAINNPDVLYRYSFNQENFKKIPGCPVTFWLNENVINIFTEEKAFGEIADPRIGLVTGDTNRFLRMWYEVSINNIKFNAKNSLIAKESHKKWFPYQKGGPHRRWYGNNEFVVNWENDGFEMKNDNSVNGRVKSHNYNGEYAFKEAITWTKITSDSSSFRYTPQGFLFDDAGPLCTPKKPHYLYPMLGFINSKVGMYFMSIVNQTMNVLPGNIIKVPFSEGIEDNKDTIRDIVKENITIAKQDWDSNEKSWDFSKHPLITFKDENSTLESTTKKWISSMEEKFNLLKKNEKELNEILIDIYKLKEELTPEINDKEVAVNITKKEEGIKSFISYAIGCLFGRYSLNEEGLILAGGDFDSSRYREFPVDEDNIVPILSGAYFKDDIVTEFINFVSVSFGEERLEENLRYITEVISIKRNETIREALRRYFLNDFYKNHVQVYNKRPIYWLFTSGKEKAFNCLIYMHRYDRTTLSRIRMEYLHEVQIRMDVEKKDLMNIIEGDSSAKEISNAKKELKSLDKKIDELRVYDELLHHKADMQIEIDLDDGVAVNYAKFEGLVAKI